MQRKSAIQVTRAPDMRIKWLKTVCARQGVILLVANTRAMYRVVLVTVASEIHVQLRSTRSSHRRCEDAARGARRRCRPRLVQRQRARRKCAYRRVHGGRSQRVQRRRKEGRTGDTSEAGAYHQVRLA